MREKNAWLRQGGTALAAFLLGWWMHRTPPVAAAPATPLSFYQFSVINPSSSLTIYNPDDRMLYVYQGATTGNTHINCSYRFHIERIGAPIERENCQIGSLLP